MYRSLYRPRLARGETSHISLVREIVQTLNCNAPASESTPQPPARIAGMRRNASHGILALALAWRCCKSAQKKTAANGKFQETHTCPSMTRYSSPARQGSLARRSPAPHVSAASRYARWFVPAASAKIWPAHWRALHTRWRQRHSRGDAVRNRKPHRALPAAREIATVALISDRVRSRSHGPVDR